jgi:DNA polymerase
MVSGNEGGKPARRVPNTGVQVDREQQPDTLDACRRCTLWHDATQPVPGAGPPHAPIMLVGEQPGDKEDQQGAPFVGPAGALLDDALQAAGVARDTAYVTNAVKHFKWELRGKRRMHKTPAQREVEACHYWLERELADVKPTVLVALGATALSALMQNAHMRLQDAFGRVMEHDGKLVIATWHPSYALRAPDPATRKRAFDDIVQALEKAGKLAAQAKGKSKREGGR